MNNYILQNPKSPFIFDAYLKMTHHFAEIQDQNKELKTFSDMLSKFPDNATALNSYAWRMAEIEINLEDALIKVRKAVILTAHNPQQQANIIDTEAEVLWKMERYDDAIKAIERAISIDSQNQYFIEQKDKFIQSKLNQNNYLIPNITESV